MLMQRFATRFKYFDKGTSTTPLSVSVIMTYLSVCGLFYQLEVGCEGSGDVTGVRLFLMELEDCWTPAFSSAVNLPRAVPLTVLLSHLQLL